MAFPDDNKSFELGTLQGYEVEGRCLTTSSFYSRTFSQNIQPRSGQFFAVIDDPTLVDNDGNRIPGPDISIDTSGYQDKIDSSGIYLMGVDGARLSARDVALPKNSLVRFCWAFEVGTAGQCYSTILRYLRYLKPVPIRSFINIFLPNRFQDRPAGILISSPVRSLEAYTFAGFPAMDV